MDIDKVVDFGKIIFVPRNHTVPGLPDMNLLILKKDNIYQAICIDIEIDAVGDTLKDACINLKTALMAYIEQMVYNYDGNIKYAIEDIVNTAFCPGDLKTLLFRQYLGAKHQYLLNKIAKKNRAKSRSEEFINAINALKRAFQVQPIQFNLAFAAGIA